MAKQKLYTISSTEEFVNSMIDKGWEYIQLSEGSLGIGDIVLVAPNEKKWNFVIREVFLNAWSSAQTIRRCRKLSQKLLKEIEEKECTY